MELDWCLGCGRQTVDSDQPYCSKSCFNSDARLSSRPPLISIPRRSLAFDLPPLLSPTTSTTRRSSLNNHSSSSSPSPTPIPSHPPPFSSSSFPGSTARFADDELRYTSSLAPPTTTRWPGKDRHGILLWAHAVSAHLCDDDNNHNHHDHGQDDSEHCAQHSHCSISRAPFPLTAQIPAPPHLSPLNPSSYSSSYSPHLTPATTDPLPDSLDAARARLLHKLSAWLAPPRPAP